MTRGGKREEAGRKPAPEPLKAITVRIPESQVRWLQDNIENRSKWLSDIVATEMHKQEPP